jgi:uncharacterized protein YegP (UPF0339 family)
MGGKFEVYEDKAGKFRFRLKAGNGEIVGVAHDTLAAAKEGCAAVHRAADGASVVEADNQEVLIISGFGERVASGQAWRVEGA